MHRQTRLILIVLLAAAIVGALLWAALRPVPVTAELATVARGPMRVTVDVDGTTRIREVYEVASPIAGTAERAPVRVGDRVIAGETVVAVVEPIAPSLLDARSRSQAQAAISEAQAALAVADSQLLQAEEELNYAQSQYNRVQELVERGVASIVRLEDAAQALNVRRAARDAAQSARDMARGTLERAQAALIGPGERSDDSECCVRIAAPADGVVLSVDRISERPVFAGQTLLSIGDPTDLEIVADPLSRDAVRIPENARAIVDRWGGDTALEARLRQIEPSARTEVSALGIEEQRVEAIFDITDPADTRPGLGNGYAVRLAIVVWEADDALLVPLGALFRDGDDWAAFAVHDGIARQVKVTLGQHNDRVAQVLGGLAEGDRVIVHPGDSVIEGVQISPAQPE
ncbi:HlyD family efflux transporter periplasmic adaptor subunit [Lutimaribacter sp. EGI FJ00015]|uniref:HlyD family efflux transporter periplasmic adaptor subunit n=1 Tax=Lutimaribacter degradans TaxID=2945989 RepID=A0ACC5ZX56_9RHOB|nr:HlyD family efflux transporter periplasmic adaptor subunit [Lutimaribacter sp. EGI FJ00013]MCM2562877.1 HlyD family efflux transporter periplasmic adaptor subunit [Lutimaribacter sp. EGI FJ00013]MCO0614034.1 HlyD family efflux transporter periplasmic adaptor subunit [Lutimaribacter sp. EGI FJ00015]MCO0637006.1 HlyD family efflux transporter periplasmic adaptor subunit [Lutimaribacter sp. EGI FJ00014]